MKPSGFYVDPRFLINELLKKIEELALNFKLNG